MEQIYRFIFILTILVVYTAAAKADDQGLKVFVEKRCYSCHSIDAESAKLEAEKAAFAKAKGVEVKDEDDEEDGDKKGGDLSGVGKERDSKWLTEFVQKPKDYFKDNSDCKKIAKKKYRKRFKGTDEELASLVTYLSSLKHEAKAKEDSCLTE